MRVCVENLDVLGWNKSQEISQWQTKYGYTVDVTDNGYDEDAGYTMNGDIVPEFMKDIYSLELE